MNMDIDRRVWRLINNWSQRSDTAEPITVTHDDNSSANEDSASPGNHVAVWMVQSGMTRTHSTANLQPEADGVFFFYS